MKEFIIRRLLQTIPVLIGLSILIFILTRIIPGDAIRLSLGAEATESQVESMRESMGLNDPLLVQYFNYMVGLFQGDWGESLRTNRNVFNDILDTFPATFELTSLAMLIAILLGIPLGVLSAVRKDKWLDQISRIIVHALDFQIRLLLGVL